MQRTAWQWVSLATWLAVAADGAPVTGDLRGLLEPMERFAADFEQTVIGPRGRTLQAARGTVALHRPGRLRWEILAPYPQLIVSDGTDIYVFDRDLDQVTVQAIAQAPTDTPAWLLTGDLDELEARFDVAEEPALDDRQGFVLLPKGAESLFERIRLEFRGPVLVGIDIVDHLDQVTRVTFQDATLDPALGDSLFKFVMPDGVDVIGDVRSAAAH